MKINVLKLEFESWLGFIVITTFSGLLLFGLKDFYLELDQVIFTGSVVGFLICFGAWTEKRDDLKNEPRN